MDSPVFASIFRQLYRCRARQCTGLDRLQRRSNSNGAQNVSNLESKWQPRFALRNADKTQDYERYPMVTAEDLRSRQERPKRVKMLLRDFIEGIFRLITRRPRSLLTMSNRQSL